MTFMEYKKIKNNDVELEISTFSNNNVNEIHLFVKPINHSSFDNQLEDSVLALDNFLLENEIQNQAVVFTRYFVSDYANQADIFNTINLISDYKYNACAISIIQQPPINDNKVVLWAYIIDDKENSILNKTNENETLISLKRNNYEHLWTTQLISETNFQSSFEQTTSIFTNFSNSLEQKGLSLKDNCIRTWLYVKDVDTNYSGVVTSRKKFFENQNMTKDTHFIASTGIEGKHFNHNVNVLMDAYSVGNIQSGQIKFLKAPDYLNPTHEYGVTFERGTSIDYGDRRHIFISGTASINSTGEVVYKKEVGKQIQRTLQNISALLADADADMMDVAQMIIYLRDIADRKEVNEFFNNHLLDIPKVILLAPVCRPEWLIEIECIAIKKINNTKCNNF